VIEAREMLREEAGIEFVESDESLALWR